MMVTYALMTPIALFNLLFSVSAPEATHKVKNKTFAGRQAGIYIQFYSV